MCQSFVQMFEWPITTMVKNLCATNTRIWWAFCTKKIRNDWPKFKPKKKTRLHGMTVRKKKKKKMVSGTIIVRDRPVKRNPFGTERVWHFRRRQYRVCIERSSSYDASIRELMQRLSSKQISSSSSFFFFFALTGYVERTSRLSLRYTSRKPTKIWAQRMSGLPLSFLFPSLFFPSSLTSPALFFFFVFHPPVNRFERWTLWSAKKDHQRSRERKEGPELYPRVIKAHSFSLYCWVLLLSHSRVTSH